MKNYKPGQPKFGGRWQCHCDDANSDKSGCCTKCETCRRSRPEMCKVIITSIDGSDKDVDGTGGDRKLLKAGMKYEVVGPGADGGPTLFAACPDKPTAELVKEAFLLLQREP